MHPLEKSILTFCQERGVFKTGDHMVVGVSGGADSMAMLNVLARLAPDFGVTMIVAHVDHGLRPEASETEETLVRQASLTLGLDCHVSHLDVLDYVKNNGLSIEEAARDLRYNFFEELAEHTGANKIAVAHTADDQAEEILLRLIRGTGRKGLSGMTILRDGRVVRPLLETVKKRILSYLNDKGIDFAIDASNTDRRYLRNRVRLDLLPYLADFNPAISQTLRQTASILHDEDTLINTLVQEQYSRLVSENISPQLPSAVIDRLSLNTLPIAIARRIFEKMLIHVNAQASYRHIESLIALASKNHGQIHLSHGLRAIASATEVSLFYPWGKSACRAPLVNHQVSYSYCIERPGRYFIPEIGIELLVEILSHRPEMDSIKNDSADVFDADTVPFPLTVRNRHPSDMLRPLGWNSPNSQKVSKILSAKKIPLQQRLSIPIATCGNTIIAILGVCIDDHTKVTDTTSTLLKVTTSPT